MHLKRITENRICLLLMAVMLLGLAAPEVSFAAGKTDPSVQTEAEQKPGTVPRTAGYIFSRITPAGIPAATDETDQGRTWLSSATESAPARSFSLRKTGWLLQTLAEQRLIYVREVCRAERFSDGFDDLTVIHYIHRQDGKKDGCDTASKTRRFPGAVCAEKGEADKE